jgi:hypothetical protein
MTPDTDERTGKVKPVAVAMVGRGPDGRGITFIEKHGSAPLPDGVHLLYATPASSQTELAEEKPDAWMSADLSSAVTSRQLANIPELGNDPSPLYPIPLYREGRSGELAEVRRLALEAELREAVIELARAGSHLREFARYHPEECTCDIEASLYMVGRIVGKYTNEHPEVLDATRAALDKERQT